MNTEFVGEIGAGRTIYVGQKFKSAGHVVEVISGSDMSWLRLRHCATGDVRMMETEKLVSSLNSGVIVDAGAADLALAPMPRVYQADELRLIDEIPMALRSEAAIEVVLAKTKWIKRFNDFGVKSVRKTADTVEVLKDLEKKYKESCPYQLDTLYRAQLTLAKQGDARSLLPAYHRRGGPGGHRLDPNVERCIVDALNYYSKPNTGKLTPSRVHEHASALVNNLQHTQTKNELKIPSLPTVTRRFKERFSAYEVTVRNYGKKRADRQYRETHTRVRAHNALDVVQFDDTDTCVFLVGANGLPCGRAIVTVGVDEATKCVLGHSLSWEPRSKVSAISAVINSMLPKNFAAQEFHLCVNNWEQHGNPGLIVMDNAMYNVSRDVEIALLDLGCEVEYARPKHPQDKSDIEHFNHRLKSEFSCHLPGWSGPKQDRELLDNGIGTATMRIDAFQASMNAWILDEYSNKPTSNGLTPWQMWRSEFEHRPPLLPRTIPSAKVLATYPEVLTFRDSGGLMRLGLRYQSQALGDLRKRLGSSAQVSIRYNPMDLSYLLVQDPLTKNYLEVPCISDVKYIVGLTNYQQQMIMKFCRERKQKKCFSAAND